jgi:hypothetical protein
MESGPSEEAQPQKQSDPKLEANQSDSRNAKEEHKTIDSNKNQPVAPASSEDKIKELQNKIAYYEREHEGFQNKLLT